MSIKGITDGPRRTPRLGKIGLGIRVPNKSGKGDHPQATEYFVIRPGEQRDALIAFLHTDKPTSLRIQFTSNDPEEFAPHHLEAWSSSGLRCRGDGEVARARVVLPVFTEWQKRAESDPLTPPPPAMWEHKDGVDRRFPCYPDADGAVRCPLAGKDCKPLMRLSFVIRDFPQLGVWTIDTSSVTNIMRTLDWHAFVTGATGGSFAWLPMTLTLEPVRMGGKDVQVMRFALDGTTQALPTLGAPAAVAQIEAPDDTVAADPDEVLQGDVVEEPKTVADVWAGARMLINKIINGPEYEGDFDSFYDRHREDPAIAPFLILTGDKAGLSTKGQTVETVGVFLERLIELHPEV